MVKALLNQSGFAETMKQAIALSKSINASSSKWLVHLCHKADDSYGKQK